MLLNKGYAVCLTGGDFGDEVAVHWLYAANDEDHFADYDQVVFTSIDYLEDYPRAINENMEILDKNE